MAKSKSYGGLIMLILVLGGGAAGAWYYFNGKPEKEPEFQTTKVARGDIIQSVTATGDLQPVITVDVGAQVSGQIKEVLVDFNSTVKAGDVLARIDESTPTQRLRQAEADLESTKASNQLTQINVQRTRELYEKKLVSQQELDNVEAQLAQSNATLLTRNAAVANAKLDLERCTITAPIDGIVLDRKTDKGRTVNASMNAPVLFTLVNNLNRMRIVAAVAEADVGMIAEKQNVKFTVDAFPNRAFTGTVSQVRNAATVSQSVVSYATIIDVENEDLKLKPGMTANVSIIVTQRPNVLRVENSVLRVRMPQEIMAKIAPPEGAGKAGAAKASAPAAAATMSDSERMAAMMEIMREIGVQRGTPATPEQIEQAKKLAVAKNLDPEMIAARLSGAGRGGKGGGGGGGFGVGGGGGRRGGGGGGGQGGASERGFTNTVVERQVFKLADPAAPQKHVAAITAKFGVSDGFYTEVIEGLTENDTLVRGVIMPGAAALMQAPGGMQNPFQGGGGRGGFGGGGFSGGGMRGGR